MKNRRCKRCSGDALLHVAIEFGANRVGGVAGIDQRGIGDQPAEPIVDRFVALHGRRERASGTLACGQRGETPFEVLLEGGAVVVGLRPDRA